MAPSLPALALFTKAILDKRPWERDPLVVRKPWDGGEWELVEHGGAGGKLCFSIMWDNGVVKPHPPLIRAMKMTKAVLERAGHRVVDWVPHRHLEIYKNAVSMSLCGLLSSVPVLLTLNVFLCRRVYL